MGTILKRQSGERGGEEGVYTVYLDLHVHVHVYTIYMYIRCIL